MKIAIIGSRGYPCVYSGYETFVKELGERLVKKGIEVTVYCHSHLFAVRPRQVNGICLVYLPTIERKALSQFVHSFQAFIHACFHSFDVILAVNAANGPWGLLTRLMKKRTAINVDGLEWLRPKWKGLGAIYFRWAAKRATRLFDRVITDCLAMQTFYRKEFATDSTMIAYGANLWPPMDPEMIKKWGLRPREYYLIVGRLVPDNNADLIAQAFLKSGSLRKLVVVGDVPYVDPFSERLKKMSGEKLLFTHYVSDERELAALYQNCYAYLHGHEFGGTNPALLQALAGGCAVCALDTVFNREMLENGEYGLFFPKNVTRLSAIIGEMEGHPGRLESFRQKAPDRIRQSYDWEKVTDGYCQLFADLIKR